jgi:hypothetical protein
MAKTDAVTLKLIEEVKRRRAEIKSLSSPNKTNCVFAYQEGDMSKALNLHVCDEDTLIAITTFLQLRESFHLKSCELLGLDPREFTHQGYTTESWYHDLRNRVGKINKAKLEAKLKLLEERLDKVISPELRTAMEIEAIQKEMGVV